jgi:DNA (cytosine-5)-methyltransferase 1
MNHLSLFSGMGGFDLASEWMGWNNLAHCEMNDFCLKILNYYWPNAKTHTNIITTDFTVYRGLIDIITGGFPCQPYSVAGQRKGTADERHLWPEMLRAIREVQPPYVVGENVPGLVNWNGGLVFEQVQADLEAEGYEVTPFILPAAGIAADHERDRIWFSAYSESNRNSKREKPHFRAQLSQRTNLIHKPFVQSTITTAGYTQSPVRDGNDGFSTRLDGITFSKWRNESIKAGGNAIVPGVAYQIFKAIQSFDDSLFQNAQK